jgi:ribonuclease HI
MTRMTDHAPLLTINTDGASRGNPGPAAFAYIITWPDGTLLEEAGTLGKMTNNQAEYTALVRALDHAARIGTSHSLVILSDSELMVRQMKGEYRVKNGDLRPLFEQAQRLAKQFPTVELQHIRREANREADRLCNEALDGQR